MPEDVQGFEEPQGTWPPRVCITCDGPAPWPGSVQCHGCLVAGVKPADTWTVRTVHWDTAVLHAIIRRKVAQFEQACPGWELVPDMQRYWEDATHPSKYVDRETTIGRKLAWTRFRVVRRHPRGVRCVRVSGEQLWRVLVAPERVRYVPTTRMIVSGEELAAALQTLVRRLVAQVTWNKESADE